MRPTLAERELGRRLAGNDGFRHDAWCFDLPYLLWNTCPLCVCGLLPVFLVSVSAIFGVDYATQVADLGAQITSDIGLSYTVFYTAGCWPPLVTTAASPALAAASTKAGTAGVASGTQAKQRGPMRCSSDSFEVAVSQFDSITGTLLRVRNITRLRAKQINVVTSTPDSKYVVFSGKLGHTDFTTTTADPRTAPRMPGPDVDGPNLWLVGISETDAPRVTPLMTGEQLNALRGQCRNRTSGELSAILHLQLIAAEQAEDAKSDEAVADRYRTAFAYECSTRAPAGGVATARVSGLAILDLEVEKLIVTTDQQIVNTSRELTLDEAFPLTYVARSKLRILDFDGPGAGAAPATVSLTCPRFVPSKFGHELLLVVDTSRSSSSSTSSGSSSAVHGGMVSRRLAFATLPWESSEEQSTIAIPQGMQGMKGGLIERLRGALGRRLRQRLQNQTEKAKAETQTRTPFTVESNSFDPYTLVLPNINRKENATSQQTAVGPAPAGSGYLEAPPSFRGVVAAADDAGNDGLGGAGWALADADVAPADGGLYQPVRPRPGRYSGGGRARATLAPTPSPTPPSSAPARTRDDGGAGSGGMGSGRAPGPVRFRELPAWKFQSQGDGAAPAARDETAASTRHVTNSSAAVQPLLGSAVLPARTYDGHSTDIRLRELPTESLVKVNLTYLRQGAGNLPWSTVRGCPEFVPVTLERVALPVTLEEGQDLASGIGAGTDVAASAPFDGPSGGALGGGGSGGKQAQNGTQAQAGQPEAGEPGEQEAPLQSTVAALTALAKDIATAAAAPFTKDVFVSRDRFVYESEPSNEEVIGVEYQRILVTLSNDESLGDSNMIHDVQLLYNVGVHEDPIRKDLLSGCKAIRVGDGWSLDTLVATEAPQRLACLTADQRIAIARSPVPDSWFNLTVPYPLWTERPPQPMWCPEEHADGCFEIWAQSRGGSPWR